MSVIRFGHKAVRKALRKWGDDIIEEVKRIVVETALLIQTEARARVPEDTGNLWRKIEVEILNDGLTAKVNVGADYAIYVEFGTGIYAVKGNGRKTPWAYPNPKSDPIDGEIEFIWTRGMKAQPFWFDAVETGRKYFKREMKKLGR